ncbi:S8 family serine peptidase [Rufibacter roseus]|uniref:S8 family serine peptidase n=1 Tax=Rufibacter roseus TaxID=1567108 RepID=A0ABW2DQC5_9BACT|nr:S8 family serine peptidase [Rufibacter roseus]
MVFKEKPVSEQPQLVSAHTQQNRQKLDLPLFHFSDAPVSSAYLDSLKSLTIKIKTVSKWLNAAAVEATAHQISLLQRLTFVQEVHPINGYLTASSTSAPASFKPAYVSKAINQIKPQALFEAGLTGKGVKIGVIDAGFYGAPQKAGLAPIFESGRETAFRDYVNPDQQHPYTVRESNLDYHGTDVLLLIGGYDPTLNLLTGLAPEATYYLARTDHGKRENRMEEENFIKALEWMDSLGVRLVNSSLGYATGYDDPKENYRPDQMDGSSMIARAVQTAIEEKGMTIILSAGNDGAKQSWQIIGTPADAPGTIAVGSSDFKTWTKQGYSGVGPAFLPYLKPDLVCFSANGTSFSAPIITGLAACLLQFKPELTNEELTNILRQSGHLYPYGNNFVGYGVPNAQQALWLAQDSLAATVSMPLKPLLVTGSKLKYKAAANRAAMQYNGGIVLFRKRSPTQVIRQEKRSTRARRIKLKRLPNETHTTLQIGPEVVELVWQ